MGNEAKTNIRTDQFTVRTKDEALQAEIAREMSTSGLDSGSALFHELFRRRVTHLPPATLEDRRYIEAAIAGGIPDEAGAYAASLRACRQLVPAGDLAKDDLCHLVTSDPVAPPAGAPLPDEVRQLLAALPTREDLTVTLRTALEPIAAPASTPGTALAELLDLAKTLPTRNELVAAVDRLAAASPDIGSLAATLPTRADIPALKVAITSIAERLNSVTDVYDRHLDVIATGVKDLAARPAPTVDIAPVLVLLNEIKAQNVALKTDNAALRKAIEANKPTKLPLIATVIATVTLGLGGVGFGFVHREAVGAHAQATGALTAAADAKEHAVKAQEAGEYMANNIIVGTPNWPNPDNVKAAAEAKWAAAKAKKAAQNAAANPQP